MAVRLAGAQEEGEGEDVMDVRLGAEGVWDDVV